MLSLHNMFNRMKINVIINRIPKGLMSLLIVMIVAYLSLDKNPFDANEVHLFEGADKVVHCIMYWVMTLIFMIDWAKFRYPKKITVLSMWVCVALAFAYSLLMEYLQDAMKLGRAASTNDAIANFIGTLLGFLLMKYVFFKRLYGINK